MEAALLASEAVSPPAHHAVTPEQHGAYAAQLQQILTATGYQRRSVPGNGDCVFEAARLACREANISLPAPLLESASEVRVFIASWIRQHKHVLYALSGGDDTWRGDWFTPAASGRRSRKQLARRRTLDDCLDLLAETDERSYDISWQSTEPGAPCFNLCDAMPQLMAHALGLRIVLVQAFAAPTIKTSLEEAQAALAEAEQQHRHQAAEAVRLVYRLQQRVRTLEATHISHRTRVRHLPCDADAVSELI